MSSFRRRYYDWQAYGAYAPRNRIYRSVIQPAKNKEKEEQARKLNEALTEIDRRFGEGVVRRGVKND